MSRRRSARPGVHRYVPSVAPADVAPMGDGPEASGQALADRLRTGVAWSALNAMLLRLGQFLASLLIARLVAPHDFGVFVVALTVYAVLVNISEVGVSSAVVREVERTRQIAPTVTSIALGTSAVLTVIMLLAAPSLSALLGAGAATGAVRVLAITVLIGGAGAVPAAVLARDYRQARLFAVDAAVFVVSNTVLVLLALDGAGVLALAWSRVAGQLVSTMLLLALTDERYRPGFDLNEARGLLRYGLPLAGANLLGFLLSNVDFVVIGRLRGATRLGYYNLAYTIAGWPVAIFTAVLDNITFTTLARARHVRAELEGHLSAALSCLCAAALPTSALCAALAGPLIDAFYGARWHAAAPALALLAAFGSVRVIIALLSDLIVALGHTRQLLLLQVVWLVALAPAMVFAVDRGGIVGAAVAQTAVGLAVVLPTYVLTVRHGGEVGLAWLVRSVGPPLASALAAGVVARLVADRFDAPWTALLLGTAAGLVTYVLLLRTWLRALLHTLRTGYGARSDGVGTPTASAALHRPVAGDLDLVES